MEAVSTAAITVTTKPSRSALHAFRNWRHDSTPTGRRKRAAARGIPGTVVVVTAWLVRTARTRIAKVTDRGKGDDADPLDRVRLLRHLPLRLACGVLGTYLCVGLVAFKFLFKEASWSVLDALYFSCACLSTIGYGDLVPSTTGGKIFAALFGMSGILVWSSAVATVGARLVHSETARAELAFQTLRSNALQDRYEPSSNNNVKKKKKNVAIAFKDDPTHQRPRKDDKRAAQWKPLARSLAKPLLLILFGGILIGQLEGWTFCDSIYFSLVTATTIGFGDFCPATNAGKMAMVVLIPVLLAAAGDCFASLGLFVVRIQTQKLFASPRERAEWLTPEQADAMDANRDGRVSKPEFVLYMLQETGCISPDDCDLLEDQFERFDVTRSGYIEEGDLEAMKAIRNNTQPDPHGTNDSANTDASSKIPQNNTTETRIGR